MGCKREPAAEILSEAKDLVADAEGVVLGGRLMAGQVPLEHFVQVRILAAQPENQ